MSSKKQDSSYYGWDINKIFIPFAAIAAIFPTSRRYVRDLRSVVGCPRSVEITKPASEKFAPCSGGARLRSPDKEACPIWDTIQEAKAFRTMTAA